jgi:hypothetical protein
MRQVFTPGLASKQISQQPPGNPADQAIPDPLADASTPDCLEVAK